MTETRTCRYCGLTATPGRFVVMTDGRYQCKGIVACDQRVEEQESAR
jgi:ribosomal protein L24E